MHFQKEDNVFFCTIIDPAHPQIEEIRPRGGGIERLGVFVEKFLGFVDLGRQVGASTTVRVVKQHELTVLLADLVLVQCALPMQNH